MARPRTAKGQAKKVEEVDAGQCDRFMACYRMSGLSAADFAKACGGIAVSRISEIGRHVLEPSKSIILALTKNMNVSPNFILLGEGPVFLRRKRV